MKRLYIFFLALFALVCCTADYDTFGESSYRDLNDIRFTNQNGDVSIDMDNHVVDISMQTPPDSLKTFDYVVLESYSLSHMASLYLVKSKFKEFPSDSAALDSLAEKVEYHHESLNPGDSIRIPQSHKVYMVVVSESGKKSLWCLVFDIPGVEADDSNEDDDVKEYASSSSTEVSDSSKDESSSSSSDIAEISSDEKDDGENEEKCEDDECSTDDEIDDYSSSSVAILDSNVSFSISFVGQLESAVKGDTIYVVFPQGTDLSKVSLDSTDSFIYRKSSLDNDPKKVKDWSSVKMFKVVSESGFSKEWFVVAQCLLGNETDFDIKFEHQLKGSRNDDSLFVKLESDQTLASAKVKEYSLSNGAKIDVDPTGIEKWNEFQAFVVTAEDGSEKKWVVAISIAEPDEVASSDKELISISADGQIADATIDKNAKTVVVHLQNAEDLASVKVNVKVSETAYHNFTNEKDLRVGQVLLITAEDQSTVEWTVSADYKKSDEAEILTFKLDATENGFNATPLIDKSKKTVEFSVAYKFRNDLTNVFFDATYSNKAKKKSPAENVLDLSKNSAQIVVVAESGVEVTWDVKVNVEKPSSENEISKFELDGASFSPSISISNSDKVITLKNVPASASLSKVKFKVQVSPEASIKSPSNMTLDLSSGEATIVVKAEDESEANWKVVAVVVPRILSLKIDGKTAVLDDENHFHVDDLEFLEDLTSLEVTELKLSTGASCDLVQGGKYNFSSDKKVTVSNGSENKEYTIRAGYQYPNSNMESWNTSTKKPNDWDNGNQTSGIAKAFMTENVSLSLSGNAAQMKSKKVAGFTFASGNLFIGTFNPKSVSQIGMLGYEDGNELIDFGKPFTARPRYLEVDFKYEPKGKDSCDVYIILENRSRTSDNGNNQKRSSSDVNTLVASAWYRASTDSSFMNPDVVSISKKNGDGLRTLRLKLQYGEPNEKSPIMNIGNGDGKVSVLSVGLLNKNGIDNHVVLGDGSHPVTHIRIVAASSADGNHYRGSEGSTLIVDNFRLIY